MEALFLDFDGVIADSIEETFIVSKQAFYGFSKNHDEVKVRELFYKYRGLVGPPGQFFMLHKAIQNSFEQQVDVEQEFFCLNKELNENSLFESLFFFIRKQLQRDIKLWAEMNPLTSFGQWLVGKPNSDCFIVTTKNTEAVELLLSYYDIRVSGIMGKKEFDFFGDKGKIISDFLDNNQQYDRASFVDDHVDHLNNVSRDSRVTCFFADWGYGKNSNYQVFDFE